MKTKIISIVTSLLLASCSSTPGHKPDVTSLALPEQWQTASPADPFSANWWEGELSPQRSPELHAVIALALKSNYQLKQQQLALAATEQGLATTDAAKLPSLDMGLSSNRSKSQSSDTINTNHDLSVDFRYEIDIWGKLSDNHKRAALLYQAQKLELIDFRSDLIRQVIAAWFKVIESRQQLALNQLRLENSQQNLDIIEAGYESGLNEALDVYLTRNELANEVSRVSTQEATLKQDLRSLELLLGQYPSASQVSEQKDIPLVTNNQALGLPSELISRKAQLRASWLNVLAQDAEVAYRYKQRFPSLSLSSSVGTSSDDLSDLLSSDLAWSLVGNLTAPIFNGGILKANEQKARLELEQAEQAYMQNLFEAFSDVENALTAENSLMTRYQANLEAAENATIAESLSFEQYQNGLVSYTTVLDARTRAYNAQSAAITLKYQLLNNHLQLFSALGGDFNQLYSQEVR